MTIDFEQDAFQNYTEVYFRARQRVVQRMGGLGGMNIRLVPVIPVEFRMNILSSLSAVRCFLPQIFTRWADGRLYILDANPGDWGVNDSHYFFLRIAQVFDDVKNNSYIMDSRMAFLYKSILVCY